MNDKRIIYDIGANNGDNIEYYLKKSDLVIAIEANPVLCQLITNRFSSDVKNKKLFVENCIAHSQDNPEEAFFYIHRGHL